MGDAKALKKILAGGSISFIGSITSYIFGYLFIMILSRSLPRDEFGTIMLAYTIFSSVSVLILLGLNRGIVRFLPIYFSDNKYDHAVGVVRVSVVLVTLLSTVIAGFLFIYRDFLSLSVFGSEGLKIILPLFALAIPFQSIHKILGSIFRAREEMTGFAYVTKILPYGILFCSVLIASLTEAGFYITSVLIVVAVVTYTILSVSIYAVKVRDSLTIQSAVYPVREFISYSWPLTIVMGLDMIIQHMDVYMIGLFLPTVKVGDYKIALDLSRLSLFFLLALQSFYYPIVSNLFGNGEINEIISVYRTVSRWILFLTLPAVLILSLYPEAFISTLFGPEYVAAAVPIQILVVSQFIVAIVGPTRMTLEIYGKTRWILLNSLVAGLANLVLNFLLIPQYGIIGAAMATGISLIIWNVMSFIELFIVLKVYPISLSKTLKPIGSAIGAAGSFGLLIKGFPTGSIIGLGVSLTSAILIWVLINISINPWSDQDRQMIESFCERLEITYPEQLFS